MQDPKSIYTRYRLFFIKDGLARFIGHLDLQDLFAKALKRAGLPIAYSQGFNPHQLLSFAQPLSLGYSSSCELLETEMLQPVDTDELVSRLEKHMPEGMKIISAAHIKTPAKSAAALIEKSVYIISFPNVPRLKEGLSSARTHIMTSKEIFIEKKGKQDPLNIRPDIFDLVECANGTQPIVKATLAAGSNKNLRPDLVAKLILDKIGINIENETIDYHREKIILKGQI